MGTFAAPLLSQTKFADSKNNNKNVDEKIFTGDPTIDTLGGGLIGVGLGALGASILGPTIGQVLGGNNGFAAQGTQSCGKRRKRQADGQTRFFLPSGGSCTCGRKKRQAASPNVTIARRSLTRMAGHTEGAEELTSLGAPGATLRDGVTLAVEISSLPEGFPTTPGPTEPALT